MNITKINYDEDVDNNNNNNNKSQYKKNTLKKSKCN